MSDQIITVVVQTLGMGGLVGAMAYVLITRTVPKMQEDHKTELKELHAAHRQDLQDQRAQYHALIQREHQTFETVIGRLSSAIDGLERQIRDNTGVLMNLHAAIQRCHLNGRPDKPPEEKAP